MGDCRIRIVFSKEILTEDIWKGVDLSGDVVVVETPTSVSFTRTFSADTTVREVAEDTPPLWKLYKVAKNKLSVFDCTTYPPKDITSWPVDTFSDVAGPKSKTLHSAGCFPSGTWLVLPPGMTPNQFEKADYDDVQFNRKQGETVASGKVEFTENSFGKSDGSKPLQPSQIMDSVAKRFDKVNKESTFKSQDARAMRIENQIQERRKRQERAMKLDRRIRLLEQKSSEKNKKVSDQIRRMLVKSRAMGDKRLKQQDRIYFECFLDHAGDQDEGIEREFRYFSPQDTFARIGSSFESSKKKRDRSDVEVLVKREAGDSEEYRRFPNAMRVYEAIAESYLTGTQVDQLIIRWLSEGDCLTPTVLDDPSAEDMTMGTRSIEGDETFSRGEGEGTSFVEEQQQLVEDVTGFTDEMMTASIIAMDLANSKGKPRKTSVAAIKVRHMQIKSKAKGDAKRVSKMDDRFFLELVKLETTTGKASSSFHFFSNKDPIERVLQDFSGPTSSDDWHVYAVSGGDEGNPTYVRIRDLSTQLNDLALLRPFGRLILQRR